MAVTDDAITKIKQMIVEGDLGPGDRLPREADLAEQLGVSRNSLREAVKALSIINVLSVRQGDGTYVTSLDPQLLMDAMSFVVDFHRDDSVLAFLEVRRILEPAASAMAAKEMAPEGILALEKILKSVNSESSVGDFVAADIEFHRQIAIGSGNPVLAALLDSLAAPTQRARIWRGVTQSSAVPRTLEEHHAIFTAISNADADLAKSWAFIHISGVEEWLRQAP